MKELRGLLKLPPCSREHRGEPRVINMRSSKLICERAGQANATMESIQEHSHRSEPANSRVLPRACSFVEAIGCRMAYEAATEAGVDPALLNLFSIGCIGRDLAWYVENRICTREEHYAEESKAITHLVPRLDNLVEDNGMRPYITARICGEGGWKGFMESLADDYQSETRVRARL